MRNWNISAIAMKYNSFPSAHKLKKLIVHLMFDTGIETLD